MLDWEPEYHSPLPCTLRPRLLHPLATELTDTGSTRQAFWQLSSVTKRHYHLYSPADKHDAMCTTTLLIDRNRDADTLAADARCQTCKQCSEQTAQHSEKVSTTLSTYSIVQSIVLSNPYIVKHPFQACLPEISPSHPFFWAQQNAPQLTALTGAAHCSLVTLMSTLILIEMRILQPSRLSCQCRGDYPGALEVVSPAPITHHCHSSLPSLILSMSIKLSVRQTLSSTLTTQSSLLILIDLIFGYSAHCKYLKYIVHAAQQAEVSWSGFLSYTSMLDVNPGSLTTSGWSDTFALWPSLLILKCVCK